MNWKNEVFANFKLYAVTAIKRESAPEILGKIEKVFQGGAEIVQLRSKELSDSELLTLGRKVRAAADRYKKLFFVNDRADLALLTDADGVHLGQDDMPVEAVRRLCAAAGKSLWIGKSTHSISQARAALLEKPDYLGVGPVFETPTKPHYQPAGLEYVRQAAAEIKIPFVAIGGINRMNLKQVLEAGARKAAVVRAVFDAADPELETRNLKQMIEDYAHA